jgi:hypothetical protein
MNAEIKKDRSPHYPKLSLSDAIALAKKLHAKAGKAQINREVAVTALGYSGLNGAALGTLGALNQYGLIDGSKGGVAISPLAIRLVHPLSASQEMEAKREAALNPKVFNEIFSGGYHECAEDVLSNHLIQNGFTPDGARKSASVYKANVEFADLNNLSQPNADGSTPLNLSDAVKIDGPTAMPPVNNNGPSLAAFADFPTKDNTLAKYSVPLGTNQATIIFSGSNLSADDFDALIEYVGLFKKQFLRTAKTAAAAEEF